MDCRGSYCSDSSIRMVNMIRIRCLGSCSQGILGNCNPDFHIRMGCSCCSIHIRMGCNHCSSCSLHSYSHCRMESIHYIHQDIHQDSRQDRRHHRVWNINIPTITARLRELNGWGHFQILLVSFKRRLLNRKYRIIPKFKK